MSDLLFNRFINNLNIFLSSSSKRISFYIHNKHSRDVIIKTMKLFPLIHPASRPPIIYEIDKQ